MKRPKRTASGSETSPSGAKKTTKGKNKKGARTHLDLSKIPGSPSENNDGAISMPSAAPTSDDSDIEVVNTRQIKPLPAKSPAKRLISTKRPAPPGPSNVESLSAAAESDQQAASALPPKKRLKPKPRTSDSSSLTLNHRAADSNSNEHSLDPVPGHSNTTKRNPFNSSSTSAAAALHGQAQLQQELLNLQQQYEHIRIERQALSSRTESLVNDNESQRLLLEDQTAQIDKLKAKISRLRDAKADLANKNNQLTERYTQVKGELEQWRSSFAVVTRERDEALLRAQSEEEVQQLRYRLAGAENTSAKLRVECKNGRDEAQRLLSENFMLRSSQQSLNEVISGGEVEKVRLKQEVAQEREKSRLEVKRMAELQQRDRERIAALEKQLRASASQIAALQEQQQHNKTTSLKSAARAAAASLKQQSRSKRQKESSSPESSADERPPAKRVQREEDRSFHNDVPSFATETRSSKAPSAEPAPQQRANSEQPPAPQASTSRDPGEALRRASAGQVAHKQGNFPMAVRCYTEALVLGLDAEMAPKVQYNRASAQYECDKLKLSRSALVQADCRELISRRRDHFKAQRLMGRSYVIDGNPAEALKHLQLALATCPESEAVFRRDTKAEIESVQASIKAASDRLQQEKEAREEIEFAPMRHLDYWTFLGVRKNADQDQIKKAIRKMWLRYHPDRGYGSNMKIVQKINAAKDFLLGSSAADLRL